MRREKGDKRNSDVGLDGSVIKFSAFNLAGECYLFLRTLIANRIYKLAEVAKSAK